MDIVFQNRREAGSLLAGKLDKYLGSPDTIILALPRGGVPVAYEVGKALQLPIDVFIVRKLGTPWNPELAMGAIAGGGVTVFNDDVVRSLGISQDDISKITEAEKEELKRREFQYRQGSPEPVIKDKTVILIDDGLATGATMKAAVKALRKLQAAKIVVAVPVAPASACRDLEIMADEVICFSKPVYFSAVGEWYDDFTQTTDEEVGQLLGGSKK